MYLNMYVLLQSPPSITCHQRNGEDQTGEEASAAAPAAPKASCQATVFAAKAQHTQHSKGSSPPTHN